MKTCCPTTKPFSAVLCFSLNAKVQSSSDKNTVSAATTLVSLAAAVLAVASFVSYYSSMVLKGSLQQLLYAFVTT